MASKRRIRRKSCARKRRFDSHELAAAAMRHVIFAGKKRGGFLHVYHCKFCKGYHFGHMMKQGAY